MGRNGAGKTTLTRVLAGEGEPASGTVQRGGSIGYLPQDPRTGDLEQRALARILSVRGLDQITDAAACGRARAWPAPTTTAVTGPCGATPGSMRSSPPPAATRPSPRRPGSRPASALPERVLAQPLGTLSGGQRRRVELARILFSDAETLLLDEPTNHLDADSIVWLRDFLRSFSGGVVVISHDVELLDHTVNRVFHLDANRAVLDVYNVGWQAYLQQRETDERRRRRERSNAEKQATALRDQAERMRAKATKAKAAQGMLRRADRLTDALEGERRGDRVAKIRFPEPAAVRQDPAHRPVAVEVVRVARGLHRRRPRRRPGLARRGPRPQRCRQDDAAADAGRRREARHRGGRARARAAARLLRAGARDPRP